MRLSENFLSISKKRKLHEASINYSINEKMWAMCRERETADFKSNFVIQVFIKFWRIRRVRVVLNLPAPWASRLRRLQQGQPNWKPSDVSSLAAYQSSHSAEKKRDRNLPETETAHNHSFHSTNITLLNSVLHLLNSKFSYSKNFAPTHVHWKLSPGKIQKNSGNFTWGTDVKRGHSRIAKIPKKYPRR